MELQREGGQNIYKIRSIKLVEHSPPLGSMSSSVPSTFLGQFGDGHERQQGEQHRCPEPHFTGDVLVRKVQCVLTTTTNKYTKLGRRMSERPESAQFGAQQKRARTGRASERTDTTRAAGPARRADTTERARADSRGAQRYAAAAAATRHDTPRTWVNCLRRAVGQRRRRRRQLLGSNSSACVSLFC
jgi:hypothetical protein